MTSPPGLTRRSSILEYLSNIRPRIPSSLRSRKSNASSFGRSSFAIHQNQNIMFQLILKDADVTAKLLEFIMDSPNGRRSLARLARTCKAFKDPALNMLWRDLDSLVPLLSLFPNGLMRRTRRPGLGLVR